LSYHKEDENKSTIYKGLGIEVEDVNKTSFQYAEETYNQIKSSLFSQPADKTKDSKQQNIGDKKVSVLTKFSKEKPKEKVNFI